MLAQDETLCTAFSNGERIANGELTEVARVVKKGLDADEKAWIFIFDDSTGERVDVDFHGSTDDVLEHLSISARAAKPVAPTPSPAPRGPGRPKLGVVAREVTLLPRHWEWLNMQPGGASVALRRLVDEARTARGGQDVVR